MSAAIPLLAACGPSEDALASLGRQGTIDRDAPIRATSRIVIDAPAERVWKLLVDVEGWPRWHPDVGSASLESSQIMGDGARFTWKVSGNRIHSRVVLFSPNQALAWTGRASVAQALHVWTLRRLGDGRTEVSCAESMNGPLLGWFYSSAELQSSNAAWLSDLKRASESTP